MKKVLFVFVSLLLMIRFAAAQPTPGIAIDREVEWRFGLKAQPSVSWLTTPLKEFENEGVKLNFGYGLIVEKRLFSSAVLATGFLVNDFGGTYKYVGQDKHILFQNQGDQIDTSIRFNSRKLMLKYLEVPVALKFRTPEINYLTYFAHIGLDFGFRIKATSDDNFRDLIQDRTGSYEKEPVTSDVNFMRMGLQLGLGTEYSLAGNTAIMIGVSYVNGFTNVMRKESDILIYSDQSKVKQQFSGQAVNLNIAILF
ncbi:MAG: porin family protein [Bacteroidales bacterium]